MPRVTAEHREARREQIVNAAIRCVATSGFHKTTMADVIRESDLSAGAVYGYFRSKDELIVAIADHAVGIVAATLDGLTSPDRAARSLPEALERLGEQIDTMARERGVDITAVAVSVWAEAVRDESIRELAASKFREVRARLASLFRALQDDGRWSPRADPDEAAIAALSLLPGLILQRLIVRDIDPARYRSAVASLLASPSHT